MDNGLIPLDPRPNRSDAVKNHELLLQTAQRLFAEEGVEAVTMSAIARAAHVGKGTLYRHFPDKAAVCHALLDQEQKDLQERTLRRMRGHPDSVHDNLRWFVEQVLQFVIQNDALLCEASNHASVSILQHPAHLWWRQTILGLLSSSDVTGDPDYAADTLYLLLDVQTIRFQRYLLGYDTSRVLDGLLETIDRLLRS